MSVARFAGAVHRWLALVVGVQLLLWVASGAFFAVFPIERVRSEHRIREVDPGSVEVAGIAPLSAILASVPAKPTRITLEQRSSGPVLVAEFGTGRPMLFDAASGSRLSPIGSQQAARIAVAHLRGEARVERVSRVEHASPEYRGRLPAWRVQLADPEGLAVYVSEDTGAVTARRSDLWRLYDALWALHIMDWRNHEDFNNGLLVVSSLAALVVAVTGIVLLPFRIRWPRRRATPSIGQGRPE